MATQFILKTQLQIQVVQLSHHTWEWGDGPNDDVISPDSVAGGVKGGRIAHTFTTSTEQEVQRTVTLTLDSP